MPKSTFVINRFAVFITRLCAAAQPALFPRPIPVLALRPSRRDCGRSRHAEPFAQRHTSLHGASSCPPLSGLMSSLNRAAVEHDRNPQTRSIMLLEKGSANAPSRPELPI